MTKWLEELGKYKVERQEIHRPGGKPYYAVQKTGIGVLHTTEGDTIAGAYATLAEKSIAPHFIVGEDRILQCRPIGSQASALRGTANQYAEIQIEMVARTRDNLWLPIDSTLLPTLEILAWASTALEIPLQVPNLWPDDLSDMHPPYAINNARRRFAAKGPFPIFKGWWMHLEIPFQDPTWHWDCGKLRRTVMLERAENIVIRTQAKSGQTGTQP